MSVAFDLLCQNFDRLCEEDGELMEREIFKKEDHSKRREELRGEIVTVVGAMVKEVDKIVSRHCPPKPDEFTQMVRQVFGIPDLTPKEDADESTK